MSTYRHMLPEPVPAGAGVRFLSDTGGRIVGLEWEVPEVRVSVHGRQWRVTEVSAGPDGDETCALELAEVVDARIEAGRRDLRDALTADSRYRAEVYPDTGNAGCFWPAQDAEPQS